MSPGMVWLQLIPLIGLIWQFFVVTKIADSISKKLETTKDDSILGISNTAIDALDKRPTFAIGITYCILSTASIIWNMVTMQTTLDQYHNITTRSVRNDLPDHLLGESCQIQKQDSKQSGFNCHQLKTLAICS
ncbi:MAG TPA: hypothetical protein VGH64_17570 [Puia sp.]|jgi:hypothetical protein